MPTGTLLTVLQCFARTVEILAEKPNTRFMTLPRGTTRPSEYKDPRHHLPGTVTYEHALAVDVRAGGPETTVWVVATGTMEPSGAIRYERDPLGELVFFCLTRAELSVRSQAELIARVLKDQPDRTRFLTALLGGDVSFHAQEETMRLGHVAATTMVANRRNIADDDQPACYRYDPNVPALLAQLLVKRLFPKKAAPDRLTAG